jgi:uncharacterized membrane protein
LGVFFGKDYCFAKILGAFCAMYFSGEGLGMFFGKALCFAKV